MQVLFSNCNFTFTLLATKLHVGPFGIYGATCVIFPPRVTTALAERGLSILKMAHLSSHSVLFKSMPLHSLHFTAKHPFWDICLSLAALKYGAALCVVADRDLTSLL